MLKYWFTLYLSIYLSIAFSQSPGKVTSNLQWWFKANQGVSTNIDGAQVDNWSNYGDFNVTETFRSTLSSNGFPQYISSGINFNPIIRFSFSKPSVFQTTPSKRANMSPLEGNSTFFSVFKSSQNRGSLTNNVFYYTPNIISTETGVSTRDYAFGFVEGKIAVKCDNIDYWSLYTTNSYIDSPFISSVSRTIDPVQTNPAKVDLLVNGLSDQNRTYATNSYLLNSSDYNSSTVYYGLSIGALTDQQLTEITPSTAFDGDIAELIVYDRVLNANEVVLVNSYLAIKYGITLSQVTPYHYLNSENTKIWDADDFGLYNNSIAGIGRDDSSGLYQPKSKSVNPYSMVTISNPSSLNNMDFLTWSDNGLPAQKDSVDIAVEMKSRLKKVWRIQKTGEIGNVTVSIDLNTISNIFAVDKLRLFIDDDGIFKTGKQLSIKPTSIKNNIIEFETINFSNKDARFFTIGEYTPKPHVIVYQLISPNNDGLNESLFIEHIELYLDNEISVFNTEGNLVYNKKNYQNDQWDCSKIIDGNYYYILTIAEEKLSGHLVVKR